MKENKIRIFNPDEEPEDLGNAKKKIREDIIELMEILERLAGDVENANTKEELELVKPVVDTLMGRTPETK